MTTCHESGATVGRSSRMSGGLDWCASCTGGWHEPRWVPGRVEGRAGVGVPGVVGGRGGDQMRAPRLMKAWGVGLFVLGLWCSRAFTVPEYFERTYELGWYSSGGDAIAIPIAGNFLVTLFCAPFVALLLLLALRKFPTRVRLLVWSDDYLGSSLLWTSLCIPLCYFEVSSYIGALRLQLPVASVVAPLWLGAWLLLRAILICRKVYPPIDPPKRVWLLGLGSAIASFMRARIAFK
jgi:hypothetical protein